MFRLLIPSLLPLAFIEVLAEVLLLDRFFVVIGLLGVELEEPLFEILIMEVNGSGGFKLGKDELSRIILEGHLRHNKIISTQK